MILRRDMDLQFGHKLLEEQGAAPKEFRKSFIKYKSLKKHLKYRQLSALVIDGTEGVGTEGVEAEKAFLRLLHTQLKEVDRSAAYHCPLRHPEALRMLSGHS